MTLLPLPETHATTRDELQRVATHVLARRRFDLCGKLGLRATPGGVGTPACGPEHEIVRVAGARLVRETSGAVASTTSLDLTSATLASAAALAQVDLSQPFEAGHDTPPVGDPDRPLAIDATAAVALAEWFRFGWDVLDTTVAALGPDAAPSVVQLWPEHFDAGVDVAAGLGGRVNLGASPGDSFQAQPYLYLGPWEAERPGDASYWNAPLGAVLTHGDLAAVDDLADGNRSRTGDRAEVRGRNARNPSTGAPNLRFGASEPGIRVLVPSTSGTPTCRVVTGSRARAQPTTA